MSLHTIFLLGTICIVCIIICLILLGILQLFKGGSS